MEYHLLGNTDLKISRLGLGTVQLGMPYGLGLPVPPSDDECVRFLHRALDTGINFFDTAATYGRSEELLGRAFSGLSSRPIIATKVSLGRPEEGKTLRQSLRESLERSLQRLHLETMDLLQFHNVDPVFISSDILEAMEDLTRCGKVRYWGASTYGEEAPRAVLKASAHFSSLQVAYNVLDRSLDKELFPACRRQGMGIIFRSIFLKGVLSDRLHQLPPHLASLRQAALQVEKVGSAAGIPLPALALRFAAYSPFVHATIFGTTSIQELEENTAFFEAGPLPEEILDALFCIEVADQRLLNPGNWNV